MKLFWNALALTITVQVVLAVQAQAYLDPGTGSFIFQTLVAMVVGAAFTMKLYWHRLKDLFRRRPALPVETPSDRGKDEDRVA
jgi:hypothetical protein